MIGSKTPFRPGDLELNPNIEGYSLSLQNRLSSPHWPSYHLTCCQFPACVQSVRRRIWINGFATRQFLVAKPSLQWHSWRMRFLNPDHLFIWQVSVHCSFCFAASIGRFRLGGQMPSCSADSFPLLAPCHCYVNVVTSSLYTTTFVCSLHWLCL